MPRSEVSDRSSSSAAREAARAAGLRYVSDEEPGIRRRRAGRGLTYVALLARLVRDLLRTEEENLFAYENGTGTDSGSAPMTRLRPEHVNEYLRAILGADATAKDFRTWMGSVEALRVLVSADPEKEEDPDRIAIEPVDAAGEVLGNVRATARSFYVHPGLLEAFESGDLAALVERAELPPRRPGFRRGERLLLALLPHLKIPLDTD